MTSPVEPGSILAGKFRIERVLGLGGMGVVVAARHLQLDELVAIKFLLPEAVHNADAVARFEREARAAVKIRSEHIARVSDVGVLEWGAPYMVMEYLHGRDLGAVLAERGPMPVELLAEYLLQACEALAEAHALGIVHRDLKPANLFLTERADGSPCIKVLDFGISKLTRLTGSERDVAMTHTAVILGSPLYMSPEQLQAVRDIDMRADLWALGVILFELLTARPPFYAETLPQLCTAVLNSPPTPLRDLRPDLPEELQGLILWCLEKDRALRVPSVAEFAMKLADFAPKRCRVSVERIQRISAAAGLSSSSVLGPPPSSRADAAPHGTLGAFGRTTSITSSGKWWAAGVGVAAVAVGATLFVVRDKLSGPTSEMSARPPDAPALGAVSTREVFPEATAPSPPPKVEAARPPSAAPELAPPPAPSAASSARTNAPRVVRGAAPSPSSARRPQVPPGAKPGAAVPKNDFGGRL